MRARTLGICMPMLMLMATAGCASSGSRFTRPQPETLVLGKTTHDEVVRQVGEPVRTGTGVKNDQPLKVVGYWYYCGLACKLGEERDWTGKFYGRAMHFFFSDDVLVGYDYTSTHDTDDTDFDDTKAYQLKKGQTTRSQVIELLGKPSGMYIYPMISSKTDTALVYVYQGTKHKPRFPRGLETEHTSKFLVVSFDTQDLLTGAEFGPGGER